MRGNDRQQADMYSYLSPEERVRGDHRDPNYGRRGVAEHVGALRTEYSIWISCARSNFSG